MACEHYYFGRVGTFVHSAQQLHAVHARHVYVAEHHVNIALFQFAKRGLAIRRCMYSVAQTLQLFLKHETQIGLVLCYQKSSFRLLFAQPTVSPSRPFAAAGKRMVNVVPAPIADFTSSRPP